MMHVHKMISGSTYCVHCTTTTTASDHDDGVVSFSQTIIFFWKQSRVPAEHPDSQWICIEPIYISWALKSSFQSILSCRPHMYLLAYETVVVKSLFMSNYFVFTQP